MYWLETIAEGFEEVQNLEFKELSEGLSYYHATVHYMMLRLPADQWFDLKLMRHGKEGDFMPERDQVVRSWVY